MPRSKKESLALAPYLFAKRYPRKPDQDSLGRVLVWDGAVYQPRSAEILDDRDLWAPMPRRPTKAMLERAGKVEVMGR